MSLHQEQYPPDIAEVHSVSSPTSSGSREHYHPNIYDEANVTEFPFPPPRNHRGVGLRHSRSHLLKHESNDKETQSRPRRSSSHSRHSSRSISAHLILTNERLTQANARNIALETQKEELLVRFVALARDKASVEADLRTTQESLQLYQAQLELAQKEVNRATDVVRKVDQARVQAEDEVARLRSRVRQLETEKSTRRGWEEGWDIGFQEGIERAQAETSLMDRFVPRRRGSSTRMRDGETDDGRGEADDSTASSSLISTRNRKPFIPEDDSYVVPSVSSGAQPAQQSPLLSRTRERARSIASRLRSRSPPSSEPHPSRPQSRSSRAQTYVFSTNQSQTSSPEVIHPLPIPRPPSSLSHHSLVPPDNYIPTMTPMDHFIPMPPPHELSNPVPSATQAPSEPDTVREQTANQRELGRNSWRSRAASTGSRASTRISEYDLVSPPARERAEAPRPPPNFDVDRGSTPTGDTGSRRMVEEWRDIVSIPPSNRGEPDGESRPEPEFLRTPPQARSSHTSERSRSPRVSGGPRKRKIILQPTPLSVETLSQMNPQGSSGVQHTQVAGPADREPQPIASPPRHHRTEQLQQQAHVQSGTSSSDSSPPAGTARTKTPVAWFKRHFQRSYSSPVIPNIQIEPPSQTPTTTSSNDSSRLNPVLLSPEDANRPIALPNDVIAEATRGIAILPSSTPVPNAPITIRLPDGELPLGFVPTTPMMAYATQERYDSDSAFSPIPDNHSLPDPFRGDSPQRPSTAASDSMGKDTRSPGSRAMTLGGHWGWASPDSARLSRPLSLFSDD
ncbi:hypothetical protein F5876DRAFT_81603 [Lentinula aff. lateritia]|uniref:Uncharacterized protein n=1 Tax=Lentinula aff. lateritia TaxID=2804960 RepID=A0ACC1TLL7_9AGAR|nr:hypothetical protein F5876DRAFT_81603 [Lentinula aff. lateritia]